MADDKKKKGGDYTSGLAASALGGLMGQPKKAKRADGWGRGEGVHRGMRGTWDDDEDEADFAERLVRTPRRPVRDSLWDTPEADVDPGMASDPQRRKALEIMRTLRDVGKTTSDAWVDEDTADDVRHVLRAVLLDLARAGGLEMRDAESISVLTGEIWAALLHHCVHVDAKTGESYELIEDGAQLEGAEDEDDDD